MSVIRLISQDFRLSRHETVPFATSFIYLPFSISKNSVISLLHWYKSYGTVINQT